MKILLVRPWTEGYGWNRSHSVGLAALAGYLRNEGHDISILDATFLDLSQRETLSRLKTVNAQVVGVTAMTHEIGRAGEILRVVKSHAPTVHTVLGGPHSSGVRGDCFTELAELDFAVVGEGEQPVAALLRRLSGHSADFTGIGGLTWRGGRSSAQPWLSSPQDLLRMPQPAVDLYYDPGFFAHHPGHNYYLCAGRGCCFDCAFCCRVLGSQVRWRTVEAIVAEWATAVDVYGARRVHVVDDVFLLPRPELRQVLSEMMAAGINRKATFTANAHVNLVDREIAALARRAGCDIVGVGIESGNDEVLRSVGRPYTVAKAEAAVRLLREEGLRLHCYFILGHPGETHRTALDTLAAAIRMNPHEIGLGTMVPYPGTQIHEMAVERRKGLRLANVGWESYDRHGGNALEHDAVRGWHLRAYVVLGYLAFYSRRGRFVDMFRYLRPRLKTAVRILWPRCNRNAVVNDSAMLPRGTSDSSGNVIVREWQKQAGHGWMTEFFNEPLQQAVTHLWPVLRLGGRVLDLGCGEGALTRAMAAAGLRAFGIDSDLHGVQIAVSLAPNARYQRADAEELPFADETFDAVIGVSVLQYVNRQQVLRECVRILKPGGRAAFIDNLMGNPAVRLYRGLRRAAWRYPANLTPRSHIRWQSTEFSSVFASAKSYATHLFTPLLLTVPALYPQWMRQPMPSGVRDVYERCVSLDRACLRRVPALARYCWCQLTCCTKSET